MFQLSQIVMILHTRQKDQIGLTMIIQIVFYLIIRVLHLTFIYANISSCIIIICSARNTSNNEMEIICAANNIPEIAFLVAVIKYRHYFSYKLWTSKGNNCRNKICTINNYQQLCNVYLQIRIQFLWSTNCYSTPMPE